MSDVKGVEISDIFGLSEPLTKLIEVCSSAIGTAYKPRHERKMTDAKVYEIKQIGEAIRENSDLPVNYQYRNIGINITDVEDLAQRAQVRLLHEEMKRQQNVEAVADNAYNEIMDKEHVTSEPVDEDWKTRFFGIAKDISSEGMQKLWGKILAGEVEKPGSFSLRTLEAVRNISRTEASTFQKIAPLLIDGGGDLFITSNAATHDKYGVTYEDIMLLDECGLILSNGTVSITISIDADSIIAHNGTYCLLTKGINKKTDITFGVYSLTTPGRELLQIVDRVPNEEYFLDFAEYVFKENRHVNLDVQKVRAVTGHTVQTTGELVREFRTKQGAVSSI